MADGDVVLDRNFEVDTAEGTRVELFAVESSSAPGGYYYRFQYYDPDAGETILRYDKAHDSDVGPHHRHSLAGVPGIAFAGLQRYVERFRHEVTEINARR
jgi:hypothetical protein